MTLTAYNDLKFMLTTNIGLHTIWLQIECWQQVAEQNIINACL